jgi:mono/diheme cytochrome c family protein
MGPKSRRLALMGAVALALAGCGERKAAKMDAGEGIYQIRCTVCHGPNGEGKAGLYPPLMGSERVKGPPERMAAIILDGLQGSVAGYTGVMPGWRGYLRDAEIAAVMTWLRQRNGAGPVSPVEVNRVRTQTAGRGAFWTPADLQNLRLR